MNIKNQNWHASILSEVCEILQTSSRGLSHEEVKKRRKIFGENKLTEQQRPTVLRRILRQLNNALIYILLIATCIAVALSHWIDASVVLFVVIVNTTIGLIQENKAENALKVIQNMLTPTTTVIRENKKQIIESKDLVIGDIVVLESGNKIPADLRLFNVKDLQIQEAILTGESKAINKSAHHIALDKILADRHNMAYSGTLVTYGRSLGIVVAIGNDTEIGRINGLIKHIPVLQTPLLNKIAKFSHWLTSAIIVIASITFVIGLFLWDDSKASLLLAVISLAVAAIPEGLPAIITITLALGVSRMAKRKAIVRNLPAIETTGSITTICTDKTGTITTNELIVRNIEMPEHTYQITGDGYNDNGNIYENDELFDLDKHRDLICLIRAGFLCNEADLYKISNDNENQDIQWQLHGNPVDGALLALGLKAKFNLEEEKKQYPQTDFIPFSSEHKLMASLHHDHNSNGYIFLKGAPEKILSRCCCERYKNIDRAIDQDFWHKTIHSMAKQGQRLLAIAVKQIPFHHNELCFTDVEQDFTLLGIVGLIDPPRTEVISAIKQCKKAGIKVKMITGDHAITACSIAEQIGIENSQDVVTGQELDKMSDEDIQKIASQVNVYARTLPEHKLRLVQALQKNNEIVAMTGDGVNDSPALKQADIGIAMGKKGSEASKEVADMILTDDNFATIVDAIAEGRNIYDNIKKTMLFVLPTNGGEALLIVLAIVFDNVLPISATQILWLNMVTAVTFALSLAFEPAEDNIMIRNPRGMKSPILNTKLIQRIVFTLILMTCAGFFIFSYENNSMHSVKMAQCAVVNMLVAGECVYLFSCRKLNTRSALKWKTFFANKVVFMAIGIVITLQILFTYCPNMEYFFGVKPIGLNTWIHITAIATAMFLAIKYIKVDKIILWFYRHLSIL